METFPDTPQCLSYFGGRRVLSVTIGHDDGGYDIATIKFDDGSELTLKEQSQTGQMGYSIQAGSG